MHTAPPNILIRRFIHLKIGEKGLKREIRVCQQCSGEAQIGVRPGFARASLHVEIFTCTMLKKRRRTFFLETKKVRFVMYQTENAKEDINID
jgi:hypothetical protein